jgi:hypothetical protein
MKVGYTEFSFGYAFTENLIRSSSAAPIGAPVFPNLLQEGQSGFDVRINFPAVPLFFQYKLPEIMRRATAFEIAKWECPGLTVPFFRIAMMRRDVSRQHELLMELEARYPLCVYYAAPCLRNVSEFDRAYNAAAVSQRSSFFSPTEIGALPDNKAHTIAYRRGLEYAYFCSQPKQIKAKTYEELAGQLHLQFEQHRFHQVEESARQIREIVLEFSSPAMREMQGAIDERITTSRLRIREAIGRSPEEGRVVTDILVAREIARVDLGVDVMVAQPRG